MLAIAHRIRRPHFEPHVTYDVPTLCSRYNFPKVSTTKDPIIGIIELGGGFKSADITAAFAKWALPAPTITVVSVGGAKNAPGGDADGEVVLDIEVAAAAYAYCTGRAAQVRVYFARNTDADFIAAVLQAAQDGCATISISWGAPEDSWGTSISAFNAACVKAVAAGAVIFAASGDNDSGDGESGAHVDYPASDPNVIGCGGTSLSASGLETVWNDGRNGTGGGYSTVFAVQPWQVGAPVGTGRMVPDVAGNADPQTGYQIYLNGTLQVIGGTSAVAPLYSGLFAAIAAVAPISGALPKLWQNPAAFHDITSGNNGKWRAGSGPDACTGLGSPNGSALLKVFAGATPPPVSPPSPPVPPPPPPLAKLGKIEIDLDALTYSVPSQFHPVG